MESTKKPRPSPDQRKLAQDERLRRARVARDEFRKAVVAEMMAYLALQPAEASRPAESTPPPEKGAPPADEPTRVEEKQAEEAGAPGGKNESGATAVEEAKKNENDAQVSTKNESETTATTPSSLPPRRAPPPMPSRANKTSPPATPPSEAPPTAAPAGDTPAQRSSVDEGLLSPRTSAWLSSSVPLSPRAASVYTPAETPTSPSSPTSAPRSFSPSSARMGSLVKPFAPPASGSKLPPIIGQRLQG